MCRVAFLIGKTMITSDLIKIDNQTVPGLKSYNVRYEKIWSGASTNMRGDHRATTLGKNIIISAEFGGELLQADITSLLEKLDQDYFSVTFYDPQSDTTKTASYFVDGYDVELLSKHKGQFQPIIVDFKPVTRAI